MGRVEVFDHTADLGLRVTASDLDDLFRTAAEGLFDVVTADRGGIEPREPEAATVEADSLENLLVAWLNELIFRVETKRRLYGRFDVAVDAAGGPRLTATLWGEPIDRDRHVCLWHGDGTGDPHGDAPDPALLQITSAEVLVAARALLDQERGYQRPHAVADVPGPR